MKNNKKPNWEEEFEKKFTAFGNVYAHKKELTGFIKKQITKAKKEAVEEFVEFFIKEEEVWNPYDLKSLRQMPEKFLKSLKEK